MRSTFPVTDRNGPVRDRKIEVVGRRVLYIEPSALHEPSATIYFGSGERLTVHETVEQVRFMLDSLANQEPGL